MPQIVIDQERCNHCGACVALCNSGNVYAQENDTVQVANIENCWSCGHCVAVCPTDALTFAISVVDQPAQGPGHLGRNYRQAQARVECDEEVAA